MLLTKKKKTKTDVLEFGPLPAFHVDLMTYAD